MYKYLIVLGLFVSCTPSADKVAKEELSLIYENAKDFYKNKDYDLAYKNAHTYWQKVQEKEYRKETGNALNLLGVITQKQEKFPEALGFYLKAADIKEMLGDSISMSNTYNNIGAIYEKNGAYEEALRYHFKAIKIRENAGNQPLMEKSYRNTALAYKKNKQYKEALHYFHQSLEISKALSHEKRIARTFNHIGVCYEESKDYINALYYYNRALAIWGKLENKQKTADIYNNLAVVYMNADSLSKALDYAFKSIEIKEKEGVEDTKVYTYNTLSDIYHKQGQTDQVIEYAEKCIPLAEKYGTEEELLKAYNHAYESYLSIGNKEKIIYYLEKTNTLRETMYNQRERFYDVALSQVKQFEEVEKQHQLAKANIISVQERELQRNYFIILIFSVIVCFAAFGLVFARKHSRLREVAHTFPAQIRHSLSKIEDIFFYIENFPEDALFKLKEADNVLVTIDQELRFFLNRVRKGIRSEEYFDPSMHLNDIISNSKVIASRRRVGILHDITEECFINTHKRMYLSAFEHLLRSSIKCAPHHTPVTVTLWESTNTLWLEIRDARYETTHNHKEQSYLNQLEKMGGIVTSTSCAGKGLEVAIGFDLA